METVYLETSFISYVVALPSRDILMAARQQLSRKWWESRRRSFQCVVSEAVIREISRGDVAEMKKRLALIGELTVLPSNGLAESLTREIMQAGILPARAIADASHIAVAAVHQVDYLLTWNCKHLANAQLCRRVRSVCESRGFAFPVICTPEELNEETSDV